MPSQSNSRIGNMEVLNASGGDSISSLLSTLPIPSLRPSTSCVHGYAIQLCGHAEPWIRLALSVLGC